MNFESPMNFVGVQVWDEWGLRRDRRCENPDRVSIGRGRRQTAVPVPEITLTEVLPIE
jgi:hypothetical protein